MWVVFDWGDVLIRYRPQGFLRLAETVGATVDEVVAAIQLGGLFQALLVGEAEPEAMSARIEERFRVALDRSAIAACFAGDVQTPMPGMFELLEELASREVSLAVLSNTFFGHWDHLLQSPAYGAIHRPMASHLIGAAKPSPEIYCRAQTELRAEPAEVVFFDDQPQHVDAAQQCGWQAHRFETAEQVRAQLQALAVLP